MTAYEETIVLITGGNGGIGYGTAKNLLLSSARYHVILGARSPLKGEQALMALRKMPGRKGNVSGVIIDVDNIESIARSAEEIGMVYGRVDVLINNAGICPTGKDMVVNLRNALTTNVLGAVAVTEYYKHLLRRSRSPRIIFVSSGLGSISQAADGANEHHAAGLSEYSVSKTALNMAMVQVAKTYPREGAEFRNLKVFGADPGPDPTDSVNEHPIQRVAKHPMILDQGARTIAAIVRGEHDDKVGKVIGAYGVSDW